MKEPFVLEKNRFPVQVVLLQLARKVVEHDEGCLWKMSVHGYHGILSPLGIINNVESIAVTMKKAETFVTLKLLSILDLVAPLRKKVCVACPVWVV